jgi:hypothetical protein
MTREDFKDLMSLGDSPKIPSIELIQKLAMLIDASGDFKEIEGIQRAFNWINLLKKEKLNINQQMILSYFEGNAWNLKRRLGGNLSHLNIEKLIEKEIFCFRSSIMFASQNDKYSISLCQSYTNLGNLFDEIGRFAEAVEYYNKALEINNQFGMAHGNHGISLFFYARNHYDPGHKHVFLFFAAQSLEQALKIPHSLEGNAKSDFEDHLVPIKKLLGDLKLADIADMSNHSLGKGKPEQEYRNWCLNKNLFLNPLNDLGKYFIAAQDVLSLPGITVPIKEGKPYLFNYFSSMKQEFCTARYLLYKGCIAKSNHYSDKKVLLIDSLDYSIYGYNTELLKLSFRSFYSIFDKISFFINDYFKLSMKERQISFKTIWNTKLKEKIGGFEHNWPLNGLYWLSKDIYTTHEEFRSVIEPEARIWRDYRNCLEHKFLRIGLFESKNGQESAIPINYTSRDALIASTIRLAKLTRAALIYLSFSIHWEERKKEKDGIVPTMPLFPFDDNFKI